MSRSKAVACTFILTFVLLFSSCATARVLGLYRNDAREMLRNGDLDFITQAELPDDFSQAVSLLGELSLLHPAAAYYAGRIVGAQRNSPESRRMEFLLFSAALESPSLPARHEAALRLFPMILETGEVQYVNDIYSFLASATMANRPDAILLRAASLYRLERYSDAAALLSRNGTGNAGLSTRQPVLRNGWGNAVALFSSWIANNSEYFIDETKRQEIARFLFNLPAGELRQWAYAQALSIDGLLSPGEYGLILSRRFPQSNRTTIDNLQPALFDGGLLFFENPGLMLDLARAYQLTPALRGEGVNLFLAWDSLLESRTIPAAFPASDTWNENFHELESFVRALDNQAIDSRRFLVLSHAGRIERARGRLAQSSDIFRQAWTVAPNAAQADSAMWYILTNTLDSNPSAAASLFINTMPQWNNMAAFNAVLDRLSSRLTLERQWDTFFEIFTALENIYETSSRAAASLAQYAWITGRAVQEGFIETDRSAESFFRLAFEQPNGFIYYRTMAAMQLGENFSPTGNNSVNRAAPAVQVRAGSELEFLLGFFENGATSFALPYIRSWESELSIPELRVVSETLSSAGDYPESVRVVFRYRLRSDYVVGREGFYLSHPRPYVTLIERHAAQNGFRPEFLFGLIRTESLFSSGVSSHAGAVGLAQLMPATAEDVAVRIVRAGGPDFRTPNGIALTDPDVNVHLGSFYLRHLIDNQLEGSPILALKAYNGGQGRVRRWLAEDRARPEGALPKDLFVETITIAETRNFGRLVLSAAAIYGYLYYEMSMEEVMASAF